MFAAKIAAILCVFTLGCEGFARRKRGDATGELRIQEVNIGDFTGTGTVIGSVTGPQAPGISPTSIQLLGRPVPSDGSCHDWTRSEPIVTSRRKNGETWIIGNAWKFACKDGHINLAACVGTKKINFKEIPVNTTENIGGLRYKCSQEQGQYRYQEEPSCMVNNKEYKVGETFRMNKFKVRCQPAKMELVGCFYKDSDGTEKELEPGKEAVVGNTKFQCAIRGTSDKMALSFERLECIDSEGKKHAKGKEWIDQKYYKVKCDDKGFMKILGCVTTDGKDVPLGKKIVSPQGRVAHCQSIGKVVYYNEFFQGIKKSDGTISGVPFAPRTDSKPSTKEGTTKVVKKSCSTPGKEWTEPPYVYKCEKDSTQHTVGCVTPHNMSIPVNQGVVYGGKDYSCIRRNGIVEYKEQTAGTGSGPKPTSCGRKGKTYNIGEEWTEPGSNFKYKCEETGFVAIAACIVKDAGKDREVKVGASEEFGGMIHHCKKEGQKYIYKSEVPPKS